MWKYVLIFYTILSMVFIYGTLDFTFGQDTMIVQVTFSEPMLVSTETLLNINNYRILDLTDQSTVPVYSIHTRYYMSVNGDTIDVNANGDVDSIVAVTGIHYNKGFYRITVDSVFDEWNNLINPSKNTAEYWVENPLPVELSVFTATIKNKKVSLYWKTATEVNNYGFDIEESQHTTNSFTKIGFVAGSGNSNSPKEYRFNRTVCCKDVYYYRLKQIDTDGTFEYSNTVFVDNRGMKTNTADISAYPNPFNPTVNIQYEVTTEGPIKLELFNILGENLETIVDEVKVPGEYNIEFNASKYSSGNYILRLSKDGAFSAILISLLK